VSVLAGYLHQSPYGDQIGTIAITYGDTTAGFTDTLMWLDHKLCIESVETLLRDAAAGFMPFSSPTEVKLRRDGDTIEITADIMEPAHFPAGPLLAALLDAGERLLTIAERLWPNDEQARVALPYLRDCASLTRDALEPAPR
jgi:hypothetical protein